MKKEWFCIVQNPQKVVFFKQSRQIGSSNCHIALKFDRRIKFQSDRTILNTKFAASGLCEFLCDVSSHLWAHYLREHYLNIQRQAPARFPKLASCHYNSFENRVTVYLMFDTLKPRQNGRHFQTTLSNTFSWMKINVYRFEFHWNLFPRNQLTIWSNWFRQWLVAE